MRRTEYYEHQFALISGLEDRQDDIEFLYILKLCYELRLNRISVLICQLQKRIFDSISPKEPSRKLSNWVYLSGQYYAMHDAPGEAIQFSEDAKLKRISLVADCRELSPQLSVHLLIVVNLDVQVITCRILSVKSFVLREKGCCRRVYCHL